MKVSTLKQISAQIFATLLLTQLLFSLINARIGEKTSHDGITHNYNTYIDFKGYEGYRFEEQISDLSEYTLSIWVKFDKFPWDVRNNMHVIRLEPDVFYCANTRDRKLECNSHGRQSLMVGGELRQSQWYILILKSQSSQSEMILNEQSFKEYSSDQRREFFPFGKSSLSFTRVYLGINSNERGNYLQGSVRNFKLFSSYLDQDELKNAQYNYLYPFPEMYFQVIMNDMDDLQNTVGLSQGVRVGQSFENNELKRDYSAIWWCWRDDYFEFPTNTNFLRLGPDLELQRYEMDSGSFSENSNFDTTLQIWFLRRIDNDVSRDEVLFNHENALRLRFRQDDFYNLETTSFGETVVTQAPFNKWIFMQIEQTPSGVTIYATDANGKEMYLIQQDNNQGSPQSSLNIYLAQDFQGYLRGLKYFKTILENREPTNMVGNFDSNSQLMLYFLLISSTYSSNQREFQNFALQQSDFKLQIDSGSATFERYYYHEMGEQPNQIGALSFPTTYDGVTCKDNNEKLFLNNQRSYARSKFTVGDENLSQITLEFWFKSDDRATYDAQIVTVYDDRDYGEQYMSIIQQRTGQLHCYPFYKVDSESEKLKIKYEDFHFNQKNWRHISCVYDWNNRIQRATYYYDKGDFLYQQEVTKKYAMEDKDYRISLNTNPQNDAKGLKQGFIVETRLWKEARTLAQIQHYRFHQLNVGEVSSQLLSYLKLLNDAFTEPIDYADEDNLRQVEVSDVEWKSDTDIIICPLHTFKGQVDNICYRDGLLQDSKQNDLILTLLRTDDHYILTPEYSRFRNNLVRDNYQQLYNFNWKSVRVNTRFNNTDRFTFPRIINEQSSNPKIKLGLNDVAQNPGDYQVSLELKDKQHVQKTYKKTISFKTLNCLRIFDSESKESIVYKDIGINKGSQPFKLTYLFDECRNYLFDKSRMEISYEREDLTFLSNNDHDRQKQEITIRRTIQNDVPLNEYFYLKITGVWYNRHDPVDRIKISMVYGLRFITFLSLNLQTNTRIVRSEKTLELSSEGTEIVNMNEESQASRSYELIWECPQQLQRHCSQNKNKQLRINPLQFEISGLEYWKSYEIKLIGTTNFIQGNGDTEVSRSTSIIWLPVDPKVQIVGKDRVERRHINKFQLNIENLLEGRQQEESISITWTIVPHVESQHLINSNNKKQLVIDRGVLSEGTKYELQVSIIYREQNQEIWSGTKTINVNRTPWSGSLIVSPNSGTAYQTQFTLTALDWNVQASQGNERYQFYYEKEEGILVPISTQADNEISTTLPPTKRVYVKVIDVFDSQKYYPTDIEVSLGNDENTVNQIQILKAQIQAESDIYRASMITQTNMIASAVSYLENESILETGNIKEMAAIVNNVMNAQSQRINTFNSNDQRYLYESVVYSLQMLTNSSRLFNATDAAIIQDTLLNLQDNQVFEDDDFLQDDNFRQQFVLIQSNILNSLKEMIDLSQLDQETQNEHISSTTDRMRSILVKYEQLLSNYIAENQQLSIETKHIMMNLQKYSRMGKQLADINQNVDDGKLIYRYPLQNAEEPTERQSMSIIDFRVNPFVGNTYLNQSALSEYSIFFAYRDQSGEYLDKSNINDKINLTFHFVYGDYSFLPNNTVCGYINVDDPNWENEECSIEFLREEEQVRCQCNHMSFYSVIDDSLIRPTVSPFVFFSFKNWPAFVVFGYIILLYVIGFIYTWNKDNQDYRFLHIDAERQGYKLKGPESLALGSYTLKKKSFYFPFIEDLKFSYYYYACLLQIHPILSLVHKLDPEIPRFYKFQMLYTKILIIMLVCYITLREKFEIDLYTLIYILALPIILMPLPRFINALFKGKFYLNTELAEKEILKKDENALNKFKKVYIDVNLPIKLLFFIYEEHMEDIILKPKENIPYANGNSKFIGNMLIQYQQTIPESQSESESNQDSNHETPQQDNGPTHRTFIQKEQQVPFEQTVSPNEIQFDEFDAGENLEDSKEEDGYEGGEQEENEEEQKDNESQQNEDQESRESLSTERNELENKELVQDKSLIVRYIYLTFIICLDLAIIVYVLASFVSEEFYDEPAQDAYVWVVVFFLTQIIGFLIYAVVVILLMSVFVFKCCKKNKICLARFMREALVIYEDYQHTYLTKLNVK